MDRPYSHYASGSGWERSLSIPPSLLAGGLGNEDLTVTYLADQSG